MFGDTFTDWSALLAPAEPMVCAGCVSVLAGRPGDDPPPLRTQHVLAVADEAARYPGRPDLAAILRDPPAGEFVLAVAESRKRHAALRAEVSTAERMVVGLDDGAAVVLREHIAVLDAIEVQLQAISRDDILSGAAPAMPIAKLGPARWMATEATIAPLRPSLLLRLLVMVARRPDPTPAEESMDVPISERRAADLLSYIAEASAMRSHDGLAFWRSIYPHRVARFSALPLRDAVARLMSAVQADALRSAPIAVMLDSIPTEEVADVERAIRARAPLVLTLAYEAMRQRVDSAKAERANPSLFGAP